MSNVRTQLMLCSGTGCHASRSIPFRDALQKELERKGLLEEIKIIETGCNGFCAVGPVMLVQPEGIFYQRLTPEVVPHLVEEHFLKGRPVKKLFYVEPASKKTIPKMNEIPFFANQMFWVMRNKGVIDPEVIDEYIARGGYFGAAKALRDMTPEQIVETAIQEDADAVGISILSGAHGTLLPRVAAGLAAAGAFGRVALRAVRRTDRCVHRGNPTREGRLLAGVPAALAAAVEVLPDHVPLRPGERRPGAGDDEGFLVGKGNLFTGGDGIQNRNKACSSHHCAYHQGD